LGTDERIFIFVVTVFVQCGGYFLQPLVEVFLTLPTQTTPAELGENWFHVFLTGTAPGSITAYAMISARNQRKMLLRGCLTSIAVLNLFDFIFTLMGAMSYRSFLISVVCNSIGGPAGVFIVLTARKWYRENKRVRLQSIRRKRLETGVSWLS
jgi:hypothetical protein